MPIWTQLLGIRKYAHSIRDGELQRDIQFGFHGD